MSRNTASDATGEDDIKLATETLAILDPGNRLGERCSRFVATLNHVLETSNAGPSRPNAGILEAETSLDRLPFQEIANTLDTLNTNTDIGMDIADMAFASDLNFINDFSAAGLFY